MKAERDTFVTATWNFGGGEEAGGPSDAASEKMVKELVERNASIVLCQELQEKSNKDALRDAGFRIHMGGPECAVAWLPSRWTDVFKNELRLNPDNPYYRKGGHKPVYQTSPQVILCDDRGRSVNVLSYHTPAGVQEANAPERRLKALKECMETLADLADESWARAELYGGDDNVDETGGYGPWGFMLKQGTGLRQLQAPTNTLGLRKVDDFRVRGLRPVGGGLVLHGPTHHNAHIRKLRWAQG